MWRFGSIALLLTVLFIGCRVNFAALPLQGGVPSGSVQQPPKAVEAADLGESNNFWKTQRLLELLKDPDERVRTAAAKALGDLLVGEGGPGLRDPTGAEDGILIELSNAHARAVVPFAAHGYRSALLRAANDPSPLVRASAITALARIFRPTAQKSWKLPEDIAKTLIGALNDPVDAVVIAAADAWAGTAPQGYPRSPDAKASQPLVACLARSDPGVRRAAVAALGVVGDRTAVEPLSRLLKDSDPDVRRKTSQALNRNCQTASCDAIGPSLIDALADKDEETRTYLIQTLQTLHDERAVMPVLAVLNEDAPKAGDDVDACLHFLTAMKDPRAAPIVIPLTRTGANPGIRGEAIDVLGTLDMPETTSVLVEGLHDPVWVTRLSAVGALARVSDPRAVPALISALQDTEDQVMWAAIGALGERRDSRAVEPIIAMRSRVQKLPPLNYVWLKTLSKFRDPRANDVLIGIINDRSASNPFSRWEAANAVCSTGDRRALPALHAYYSDIAGKNDTIGKLVRSCIQLLETGANP
jgi:HEAT repeat protein